MAPETDMPSRLIPFKKEVEEQGLSVLFSVLDEKESVSESLEKEACEI